MAGSIEGTVVAVVVQGDLRQAPRMRAHVECLLRAGARVHWVGYGDGPAVPSERMHLGDAPAGNGLPAGARLWTVSGPGTRRWPALPRALFLPLAAVRAAAMGWRMRQTLAKALEGVDAVLVQVPPAVPLLLSVLEHARERRIPVIVDWHNLAFAMLGLRLGRYHPLTRVAARLEGRWARMADAHLCATPQLADTLERIWRIEAEVVPDLPRRGLPDTPDPVRRRDELGQLLKRLDLEGELANVEDWLLAVSPTSWSLDEDMQLLLDALAGWQGAKRILLVATGRGPGRARFRRRARSLAGDRVRVATGWLEEADYRRLLQHADLGISMHRSASRQDFPMKIVDMLEAGLPVLALECGPALRAWLPPPAGMVFESAAELTTLFGRMCDEEARGATRDAVRALRLEGHWAERWERMWQRKLPSIFERAGVGSRP